MTPGPPGCEYRSTTARRLLRAAMLAGTLALLCAVAWPAVRGGWQAGGGSACVYTLGKVMGLTAGVLLMLQFALSARLSLLDRAFGLDRLLRCHKLLGISAGVLASLHPLLIYGSGFWLMGTPAWSRWPELLGVVALTLLWVVLCTSIWMKFLELSYRRWWGVHQLVFIVVAVVAVHGSSIGSDLARGRPRAIWMALTATYAGLFVWVKLVRPLLLRANRFTVTAVERLNHNVCEVSLTSPPGRPFRHLPGQFAFLKLRHKALPAQEHPFTISSAPSVEGRQIRFTIKASGDFTARIPEFQAGDRATVDGPYGLFTHLVRATGAGQLVMIAGGIGITPILSMLRHLVAVGDDRPATLIWGNRREEDIVYRQELDAMADERSNIHIHHVLSEQDDWPGLKGYVDAPLLRHVLAGRELQSEIFLCGPPVMMTSVARALRSMKVAKRRIHTERFAL